MYYVVATLSVTTCWGNYMKHKKYLRKELKRTNKRDENQIAQLNWKFAIKLGQ